MVSPDRGAWPSRSRLLADLDSLPSWLWFNWRDRERICKGRSAGESRGPYLRPRIETHLERPYSGSAAWAGHHRSQLLLGNTPDSPDVVDGHG